MEEVRTILDKNHWYSGEMKFGFFWGEGKKYQDSVLIFSRQFEQDMAGHWYCIL